MWERAEADAFKLRAVVVVVVYHLSSLDQGPQSVSTRLPFLFLPPPPLRHRNVWEESQTARRRKKNKTQNTKQTQVLISAFSTTDKEHQTSQHIKNRTCKSSVINFCH